MNVYDFDGTIYRGDSSIDFFVYCLRRNPRIIRGIPKFCVCSLLYKVGKVSKKELKEVYFHFLSEVKDIDLIVSEFWDCHEKKIKKWYLSRKLQDDVIVTASPYFLVSEICSRLEISEPIATEVDVKNGKFLSENCYGEEKPKRFRQVFPHVDPEEFYSDSYSDFPMAKLANHAFLVSGNVCRQWSVR